MKIKTNETIIKSGITYTATNIKKQKKSTNTEM